MTNMRMMLTLLYLACAFAARAQVAVQGTVRDSVTHERLELASVTVMRHGKPLTFTKTDGQGRFRLSMKSIEKGDVLSVTYLGYRKCTVALGTGEKDLLVEMSPSEFALKEILVRGGPVTGKADTVTYDLSRFADQRDNSLKDILKKLPGVAIDKSGGISVNGKAITRFTVEGLDLTGGRYGKLNETLKAKDVKSAEVIKHDQPVKALQGKVFSDDVAMNIKLKDGAKDKFMFTLSPAALLHLPLKETTAGGKADALQIGKKRQQMYDVEYDRTGSDLSMSHHQLSSSSLSSQRSGITAPQWFNLPSLDAPIDDHRLRFNNSHDWNFRHVRKNEKGEETRLYAGYLHTTENQTTSRSAHYYIDGRQPVTTTEDQSLHLSKDRLRMDYNRNLNEEKKYGNHYILAEASQADGRAMLNGSATGSTAPGEEGDAKNSRLSQRVKSSEIHLQHTFSRMFVYDRHLLSLHSNAEFFHSPSRLEVDGSEYKLTSTLWHTKNDLEWVGNRSFTSTSLKAGVEAEHLNVNGGNTHFSLCAVPYHEIRKGAATWRFRMPVAWERYADHARSFLNVSPSMRLNVKKGNRAEWYLYALMSQNSGSLSSFALDNYRCDYRTTVLNNGVIPRTTLFAAGIDYNYKRPVMEWFWVLGAHYSRSRFNTMQDFQIKDGEYRYRTVERNHANDVFNARCEMSKGWYSLRLKTRLALGYQGVKGQQLSGNRPIGFRSHSVSTSPEIVFSPSWCDVTYSSSFSVSRLNTDDVDLQTLWNWRQSLSLTMTFGKMDCSLSAVHYHNELQSAPPLNTLLADASVVWRMKKLRLSAELRNLFNHRNYIVTSYSGVGSHTGHYHLRPREIFLKAQFSL